MLRIAALLLTVLTGFTALVYEVSWQKYLATLLGSHSEATAAVLGLFLGGLALGYSLFGRATRRRVARARHKAGCNVLYLDWHVAWMAAEQMTPEMWSFEE